MGVRTGGMEIERSPEPQRRMLSVMEAMCCLRFSECAQESLRRGTEFSFSGSQRRLTFTPDSVKELSAFINEVSPLMALLAKTPTWAFNVSDFVHLLDKKSSTSQRILIDLIILLAKQHALLQYHHYKIVCAAAQEEAEEAACSPGFQVKKYHVEYNGGFLKGQSLLQ
ncbi:cadherin-13 isoform X1, partial [Clarias magur]